MVKQKEDYLKAVEEERKERPADKTHTLASESLARSHESFPGRPKPIRYHQKGESPNSAICHLPFAICDLPLAQSVPFLPSFPSAIGAPTLQRSDTPMLGVNLQRGI